MIHPRHLYFTVFISGMTGLAVEFAASRLLGNVFGTSNLVWASIIGLILIYLTLGYFLGGRWADRSPEPALFYRILAWGGFLVGVIPAVSKPVLRLSANAFDQLEIAVLAGSFAAVLILFSVPVTLLGTASPFAVRLAIRRPEDAGGTAGRLYAVSTLGSFTGTFLAVLLFIPTIGTYHTFIVFSALMLLTALSGLVFSAGWKAVLPLLWMPVALAALAAWGLGGPTKSSSGQIFEKETAYNYIQVLEDQGYRYLRLNDGQGVHSVYHPTELDYNGPWEQVLAAPFVLDGEPVPRDVTSMAIVGLAAGTTARQATAVFGPIPIDGYEIDPQIIAVGEVYFGMDLVNINAYAQDGRWGLEHSPRNYDIISVDAYRPPYIPAHLTTLEFFQMVRSKLTDRGVMVINVGRGPSDRRLINSLAATIRQAFPGLLVMDLPGSFNSILYAAQVPVTPENLAVNLLRLRALPAAHPLLVDAVQTAFANIQPDPQPAQAFTDNRAPVEWITNDMIIRFILSGEMDMLQ